MFTSPDLTDYATQPAPAFLPFSDNRCLSVYSRSTSDFKIADVTFRLKVTFFPEIPGKCFDQILKLRVLAYSEQDAITAVAEFTEKAAGYFDAFGLYVPFVYAWDDSKREIEFLVVTLGDRVLGEVLSHSTGPFLPEIFPEDSEIPETTQVVETNTDSTPSDSAQQGNDLRYEYIPSR